MGQGPCRRGVAVFVTALLALLLTPAAGASAQLPGEPALLDFKWVVQARGSAEPKGVSIAEAATRGIDVDGGGADLTARVAPEGVGRFRLTVEKRRTGTLPVRIELVSGQPIASGAFVAFGYDARGGGGLPADAPTSFSALVEAPPGGAVADVASTAGQPVLLIADLFVPRDRAVEQEDFERVAPRAFVNYGPIAGRGATTTHVDARVTEPRAAVTEIALTSTEPAPAFARVEQLEPRGFTNVSARIGALPASLTVTLTEAGGELDALEYAASGRLTDAEISFSEGRRTLTRRTTETTGEVTLADAPPRVRVAGLRTLAPLSVTPRDASGEAPDELGFVDVVFGQGGAICKREGRDAGVPRSFCARPRRAATEHAVSRFEGRGLTATRATLVGLLDASVSPDRFEVDAAFARARPLEATLQSAPRGRAVDRTVSIRAADVPERARVEAIAPAFDRVSFAGSAPIGSLRVDARDRRRGLFALGEEADEAGEQEVRIRDLGLTLTDLPTTVHVTRKKTFGEGTVIEACAVVERVCPRDRRVPIGGIEARLSGVKSVRAPVGRPGPRARKAAIRPDADGVELRDLPGSFDLFARVTGFRRLAVLDQQGDDPNKRFALDSAGDRRFQAEVLTAPTVVTFCRPVPATLRVEPFKRVRRQPFVRVDLENLKPNTVFSIRESSRGTKPEKDSRGCLVRKGNEKKTLRIAYRADEPARRLTVRTNEGSRRLLTAEVGGTLAGEELPVPRRLEFCRDDETLCGAILRKANKGSTSIEADAHTLIDLLDCQEPIDVGCGRTKGFVRIEDLRVRRLLASVHLSKVAGLETEADIGLDTVPRDLRPDEGDAAKEVSGRIRLRAANPGRLAGFQGVDIDLPRGFFAEERRAGFSFFLQDPNGQGHANCPPGVNFLVRLNNFPDQQLSQEVCAR